MRLFHYPYLLLFLLCLLGTDQLRAQDISANYFQGDTLLALSQSGAAPSVSTFTIDETCESLKIEITDPVNAPLRTSQPYSVRVRNADGNQITDLTGRLTVTMRARSAGEVPVEFLFRSGDGTADFRTSRLGIVIPAGLEEWTELSVTFSAAEFGPSFDPADIRDCWFYLDRSNENFAGNDFNIDHIVIGGAPDPAQNSPCLAGGGGGMMTDTMFSANYFQDSELTAINLSTSSAAVTTFTLDTVCETVRLSVTDPDNAPLTSGQPYIVRLRDADGNQVTNLTDRLTVTMRARSAGEVPVDFLFRSGDGSAGFRSERLTLTIPAGLDEWTEASVTFTAADLGGFDPSDVRDLWFYLDRSSANFAGNEFYIDHIVVGGAPDPAQNSPCPLGGGMMSDTVATYYFQDGTQDVISTASTAGSVTTFEVTDCEEVRLSITDSINAPLAPFNAYIIGLRDTAGNRFFDLTDRVTATLRVRSAEAMQIGLLFRSGDGTTAFRTTRLPLDIPAGLDAWTEVTATFTGDDLGGLDPANIRDLWLFLAPGEENFPGNEFYIDHIVIGGAPDPAQNSPCPLGGGMMSDQVFTDYFQAGSLTSFTTDNAAGRVTTFGFDADCETVTLSVTDPANAPLPPFNAYQVNPTDAEGNDLTDITGNMSITMRARSAEPVNVSFLFRSGGGTMGERTDRLDFDLPGGLDEWTEFTLTFTEAEMAGFNPADLLDFWFYLDRGEANFPGNFFVIDHVAVGIAPDPAQNSPCALVSGPTSYVAQFDDGNTAIIGGVESDKFTLTTTDCEEIKIEVTDPIGAPHGAFRPIIISPTDAAGAAITNIEGQTTVFIRARSAVSFPVSVLFRSGDGSADFRTAVVTQTVVGDLAQWSNLAFTFTAAELGNFDPADLVDMWLYLDRDNDNFPGNELYIDYIAIGVKPEVAASSPCVLPDIMTSTTEASWGQQLRLFPNPTPGLLTVDIPGFAGAERLLTRVLDVTGREVVWQAGVVAGQQLQLDLTSLPNGVYFLQLRDAQGGRVTRRVVKR